MRKSILFATLLVFIITSNTDVFSQSEDDFLPFVYKGKDYEFVHYKSTWDDAKSVANNRGGYLLAIESEEKNDSIVKFLVNDISSGFGIDLFQEGETTIWIGGHGVKNVDSDFPNSIDWLWEFKDNVTKLFTFQDVIYPLDIATDVFLYYDTVYNNWGRTSSDYFFPLDYEKDNFPSKVAMTIEDIEDNGETIAKLGQWITANGDEEKYYIIDYGCTDNIITKIDTLLCGASSYTFGGKEIENSGVYQDTLLAYSECDSIVELTIDFVEYNDNITAMEDQIVSSELMADSYQWYRCDLDMAIDGANSFSLDINESGSYRLEAEKGGCTFISDCYDYCIPVTTSIDTVKCSNESITINGEVYAESGFYTQKLNQVGFDCDSTLEIEIEDIYINTDIKKNGNELSAVQTDAAYQWYNCDGDVMIEGANSQTFSLTESGDYKVEITKDGCIEYSECFEYTDAASVKDINENDLFTIDYKNGTIAINNIKKYTQIELLDLNAKTIFKSNELTQSIDISSLPSGIYFIKLQSNSKVEMFKFMIGG
jgi:hypothetical protein